MEGSDVVYPDVETTDIELKGDVRAHYMNFLSMEGGTVWPETVTIGTFQLRVIADSGVSTITNQSCMVSTQDGTDSYAVNVKDLRVVISTECTVRFESNGGSDVPDQIVQYGETIVRPEDPVREGFVFTQWYQDLDRQHPWNFDTDVVEGNVTLYAGWEKQAAEPPADSTDETTFPWWVLILILVILVLIFALRKKRKRTG